MTTTDRTEWFAIPTEIRLADLPKNFNFETGMPAVFLDGKPIEIKQEEEEQDLEISEESYAKHPNGVYLCAMDEGLGPNHPEHTPQGLTIDCMPDPLPELTPILHRPTSHRTSIFSSGPDIAILKSKPKNPDYKVKNKFLATKRSRPVSMKLVRYRPGLRILIWMSYRGHIYADRPVKRCKKHDECVWCGEHEYNQSFCVISKFHRYELDEKGNPRAVLTPTIEFLDRDGDAPFSVVFACWNSCDTNSRFGKALGFTMDIVNESNEVLRSMEFTVQCCQNLLRDAFKDRKRKQLVITENSMDGSMAKTACMSESESVSSPPPPPHHHYPPVQPIQPRPKYTGEKPIDVVVEGLDEEKRDIIERMVRVMGGASYRIPHLSRIKSQSAKSLTIDPSVSAETMVPNVSTIQFDHDTSATQPHLNISASKLGSSILATQIDPSVSAETMAPNVSAIQFDHDTSATQPHLNISASQLRSSILATQIDPNTLATQIDPISIACKRDPNTVATKPDPNITTKIDPNRRATKTDSSISATKIDPSISATDIKSSILASRLTNNTKSAILDPSSSWVKSIPVDFSHLTADCSHDLSDSNDDAQSDSSLPDEERPLFIVTEPDYEDSPSVTETQAPCSKSRVSVTLPKTLKSSPTAIFSGVPVSIQNQGNGPTKGVYIRAQVPITSTTNSATPSKILVGPNGAGLDGRNIFLSIPNNCTTALNNFSTIRLPLNTKAVRSGPGRSYVPVVKRTKTHLPQRSIITQSLQRRVVQMPSSTSPTKTIKQSFISNKLKVMTSMKHPVSRCVSPTDSDDREPQILQIKIEEPWP